MTSHTIPMVKPRLKGFRAYLTHPVLRRVVQIASALFILAITIQHVITPESTSQVIPSPEAFCPYGGLETLYQYVSGGGAFVPHTHLSNLAMLAAVLVTALLLRSAFCGWICPLGFIQEIVSAASKALQKRFRGFRRMMAALKTRGARLAILDRYLRALKYLVLAWSIIGAAAYGVMVFRDYDPWSALLNIAEFSLTPGLIVLIITLVASVFVERPWCRYACPMGAISGLVGKLSPTYLKREESACTTCKVCTTACPMGLPVHTASAITSVDCIGCLECVGVCPRNGALQVKLGFPLVGQK